MQAVCAKCSRLMCRAVVLFLVAECAQTTPMIAPLPGDPIFSIDGSVAFFKSGESDPTQPNPPPPPQPVGGRGPTRETAAPQPPRGAAAPRGERPQPRRTQPRVKRPRSAARSLPHNPLPAGGSAPTPWAATARWRPEMCRRGGPP